MLLLCLMFEVAGIAQRMVFDLLLLRTSWPLPL
jgi:hypothetical protein